MFKGRGATGGGEVVGGSVGGGDTSSTIFPHSKDATECNTRVFTSIVKKAITIE